MSRAIDAIVADYNSRKDQSLFVPEWDLTIHWDLLTIDQRQKLAKPGRTDVDVFIELAKDDAGNKLFTIDDKPKLKLNADQALITRVAVKMLGIGALTDEAVESSAKN